ncbi:MAG: hypothetical protein ACRDH7_07990 [Actinomycetota bacterium]
MSVEIRVSEHVKVLGVLNEFPSIEVPGGVQVELGDAYGDETRRVVFASTCHHFPRSAPSRSARSSSAP